MAILDADKEGFLRSERSIVQTIGRAARNANGRVMYADKITDSFKAIDEAGIKIKYIAIQKAYNKERHRSKTIVKNIRDLIAITHEVEKRRCTSDTRNFKKMTQEQRRSARLLELDMR